MPLRHAARTIAFGLLACWVSIAGLRAQEDRVDDTAPETAAEPAGDEEDTGNDSAGGQLAKFANLLRIGQTSRDILIPAVERGSMTSMTRADALTRRSEDYLDLVQLSIQFYNADGGKDARLMTPHAEFHLPTGILASDHRTRVRRSDFDLEGDRFLFDTNSRRGKFEGNVTMVIHSMDKFRNTAPEGEKPEGEEPGAAEPDEAAAIENGAAPSEPSPTTSNSSDS